MKTAFGDARQSVNRQYYRTFFTGEYGMLVVWYGGHTTIRTIIFS
jgi:hypothetical protein